MDMLHLFMKEKRPFKCDICEYSCPGKSHLKQHIASIHEGKKAFKCNLCNYSFSQKGHLNRHVASVHEGKSHSYVIFVTTAVLERIL